MSRRISITVVSTVFIGSLLIQAMEPPPTPYPLPSGVPLPEPSDESDVPPRILRIFDGMKDGQVLEVEPTGNLVVDEILRVRHERGSVLERFPDETDLGLDPVYVEATELAEARSSSEARASARAAEQLLKAARLMESLSADDSQRAELILRMREEAGKLLSE